MRFAAPRSPSPSPSRSRRYRPRSTFGVPSDSSEAEEEGSDSDGATSSSGESVGYAEYEPLKSRRQKTPSEKWLMEDTLAAVRRRLNHVDPYEEWEKETRQEAFRVARHKHAQDSLQQIQARSERRVEEEKRQAAMHEQQLKEVQAQLAAMNLLKKREEDDLRAQWKERDRQLWTRIDAVIKIEEDRLRVKQEAERKKREEEESVKREAEEKKRQEEEKKRLEEEEKRKQKEKEEEEKRKQLDTEREREERDRAEAQERNTLGFTTAIEDWKRARETLKSLKAGPMKIVKADKALKSLWSAGRRAITPKVGQLTNDASEIMRISREIVGILRPPQSHPQPVYLALLSSLSKAILLQAETEVTAEKKSAIPLAQVATNLLIALDGFADIFWAKLCQRAGGWPVPVVVPAKDTDNVLFTEDSRRKALGYRDTEEGLADYTSRVSGLMRVYFHILTVPVDQPLDPIMRLPRYWTFFSRMLKDPQLLESAVAPQVLFTALDVGGLLAREVWGQQWIRLIALLYEGVTVGYHDLEGRLIGGSSPEGIAARMRVQLESVRSWSAQCQSDSRLRVGLHMSLPISLPEARRDRTVTRDTLSGPRRAAGSFAFSPQSNSCSERSTHTCTLYTTISIAQPPSLITLNAIHVTMAAGSNSHKHSGSVSQAQNHKAQLANAYNELGKELSSQKIRVVGNYTLGKVIGEGTYGKVRMGTHRLTGSRVAIKQIPKAMSASLTREIHHHRQLHHPHVTQLYEVIATESSIWLVTELCSGGELFDYLAEKGRLTEDETRVLFGQLCLAVAYVHEKGIVHRDLKLENVLLDERCRVKLGDFGFTREFEKGSLLETFCGTTGYAAPEMLLAKKYLGPEVDVWSLGVILYTLLTGMLPFDDDDDGVMREKVIKGVYEDPEWLSDDSRNLLSNVLQVDPTKRLTIAQILTHAWFTIPKSVPNRDSVQSTSPTISRPSSPAQLHITTNIVPQPPSASTASDATFHSASSEFPSSAPTTPDGSQFASQITLRKLTARSTASSSSVLEEEDEHPDRTPDTTPSRPSIARTDSNSKVPPAYPTLGLDTGQIVHSVLTDACDATGALWWMMKRRAERKALEDGTKEPPAEQSIPVPAESKTPAEQPTEKRPDSRRDKSHGRSSQHRSHTEEGQSSSIGRNRDTRPPIPPALMPAQSAPELQFIPATPTVPNIKRPATPPRAGSPQNPLLSPTPSIAESLAKSSPSTPSSSKDKDQGSKGRKNRAGSVSIMQRATTALEAAGLVRKKSAEAVREEKERREREEKEKEKQKNASSEEPRSSHGSSKLIKTPPMRAVKDGALSSTPPPTELNGSQGQPGSPWILAGKQSPPPDTGSPADTLTSLPHIPSRGSKVGSGHRNRASLLSTFQRWFREDPKGKRKEDPAVHTLTQTSSLNSAGSSPVSVRHRGTVKGRSAGRGKNTGGRGKTSQRAKRASVSSRRSSSVNSRRSSTSMQYGNVLESPPYSASVSRQRSDPSRRSFGSHTPNSEREEYMSRPSSIHSFINHPRHRKSPSASSAGSMYVGRTASPLPKNHRRAGSGSSTRVVRQIQMTPSGSGKASHLRSNSASSAHSLQSSRPGSLYDLSETDSRRNSSPHKAMLRRSLDETPRRGHSPATFVAQKRQTPFSNPNGSGYLNSLGRSSWKKSWGLEPPGWQTRTAHPAVEVLAIYPPEVPGIRDVFSGRQSLSMGDESDWVDEEEESPAYVGGLGQMPSSASSAVTTFAQAETPLLTPPPRSAPPRTGPGGSSSTAKRSAPTIGSLSVGNVGSRAGRGKANRSPAGRSSPLPSETGFEAGGRRQLPNGRAGPAFRGIMEEDEGEEE
ncbi:hypothetical protein C8Q80DRAFT_1345139 [Daedaleopsis nitida]|nr:hypothetical protein C8Q80DRAFT_1345139 [Daedaleopsis nitida]